MYQHFHLFNARMIHGSAAIGFDNITFSHISSGEKPVNHLIFH